MNKHDYQNECKKKRFVLDPIDFYLYTIALLMMGYGIGAIVSLCVLK